MSEYRFEPKEIIFHEGDDAGHAFIIREGEVEILKHGASGEVVLAVLKKGEVFGEMALFQLGIRRSATARAITPTLVDVISHDEFEQELNQCPPRILPLIITVLDRLRSSNQRLSESEQATVILDSDINRIIVKPASDTLNFSPVEVLVARLPFRIGGYDAEEGQIPRNRQNHLNLLSSGPPLVISRQHCQVEISDGGIYMRDIGSRFTTIVNGRQIGRGKGIYKAPLQKGENEIILGNYSSPYRIIVECE